MRNLLFMILAVFAVEAFSQEESMLEKTIKTKEILISDLMGEFFSGAHCFSGNEKLRNKFKEKIKKFGKSEIVPHEIKNSLNSKYLDTVQFMEDITLQGMMHVYWFENDKRKRFLSGSPTYESFNPMELIHNQSGSFLYTVDCSGFTSILANSKLGFGALELAATAKNSLSAKYIYFAARGKLTSPIALTANPTLRNQTTISPEDQVALLWAVLNVMNQNGVSTIAVPIDVDVLTFAVEGGKYLQGNLEMSVGSGVSFAVASAATNGKVGIGYSKSLIFSSPNSAIIEFGDTLKVTKNEIKRAYRDALPKIVFSRTSESKNFILSANLTQNYCLVAGWYAKIGSEKEESFVKNIHTTWNSGVCKFELNSSSFADKPNAKVSIYLKGYGHNDISEEGDEAPFVGAWTI